MKKSYEESVCRKTISALTGSWVIPSSNPKDWSLGLGFNMHFTTNKVLLYKHHPLFFCLSTFISDLTKPGQTTKDYCKNPKNLETRKNCCNYSKIWTIVLLQSNASKRRRRNCKQCRPWSDCSSRSSLIWVCAVCPDLSVRKLRNIMVNQPAWQSVQHVIRCLESRPYI